LGGAAWDRPGVHLKRNSGRNKGKKDKYRVNIGIIWDNSQGMRREVDFRFFGKLKLKKTEINFNILFFFSLILILKNFRFFK